MIVVSAPKRGVAGDADRLGARGVAFRAARPRGRFAASDRGDGAAIEDSMSVGRAAAPGDVPAVADCLTSAFFYDPLWGLWSFPDESARARPLRALMSFWAKAGVRQPWVRMTPAAESVAVWVPPGEAEMTGEEEAEFEELIDELFGARSAELMELFDRFDEHHPRSQPHYYLSLWATHRDHAGRGVGTALMRENLAEIDSQGMPAYLESTNPLNVPRYEALGFRRRGEFSSPHGPLVTTMWRPAAE